MTLEWLIGATCTGVAPLTQHSSIFRFGDAELAVESLWRVLTGGRVRRTSDDDGQQFGLSGPVDARAEATALLVGHRVQRVDIASSGDLSLTFDGDFRLEVIVDSAGYESWNLRAPGRHIVAGSGGTIHDLAAEQPG